jgi:hypothetical protein
VVAEAVGGGRAAALAGASAEAVGSVVAVTAGVAAGLDAVADPHAVHRQVSTRQLTAVRGFAPILRGWPGRIFEERVMVR